MLWLSIARPDGVCAAVSGMLIRRFPTRDKATGTSIIHDLEHRRANPKPYHWTAKPDTIFA
jgi:hypothetical protein